MFPNSKPNLIYFLVQGVYLNFGLHLSIYVQVYAGGTINDIALAEGCAVGGKFAVRLNVPILGSLFKFHDEENGKDENEQALDVDLWHVMADI